MLHPGVLKDKLKRKILRCVFKSFSGGDKVNNIQCNCFFDFCVDNLRILYCNFPENKISRLKKNAKFLHFCVFNFCG